MIALVFLGCTGLTAAECEDAACAEASCDEWASCANGAVPVLNEFVANNATGYTDESGEFEDWIELYNPSSLDASLEGWSLSDDLDLPGRSPFDSSLTVPARGYLVLFADQDPAGGDFHVQFKLAREGGVLALARDGVVVDRIAYPEQPTDIALARVPDGAIVFSTIEPTPGTSNAP